MKEGSCWLWYACGPAATGMLLGKQVAATGAGVSDGAERWMRPGWLEGGGKRVVGKEANVDKTKQGILRV